MTSLEQAIERAKTQNPQEIFIIGGAEIYRLALQYADKLYLTLVHQHVPGDAFFPEWISAEWRETFRESHLAQGENSPAYTFLNLERIK